MSQGLTTRSVHLVYVRLDIVSIFPRIFPRAAMFSVWPSFMCGVIAGVLSSATGGAIGHSRHAITEDRHENCGLQVGEDGIGGSKGAPMLGKWSRCFCGGIQPSTARITASTLLSTDDEEAWMRALQFVFKALVSIRQRVRFDDRFGSLYGSITHS